MYIQAIEQKYICIYATDSIPYKWIFVWLCDFSLVHFPGIRTKSFALRHKMNGNMQLNVSNEENHCIIILLYSDIRQKNNCSIWQLPWMGNIQKLLVGQLEALHGLKMTLVANQHLQFVFLFLYLCVVCRDLFVFIYMLWENYTYKVKCK